jgi:hypothetical protein
MKRRDFVTSVLVAGLATPVMGDSKGGKDKGPETQEGHDGHGHHDDDERLRNHQVNFGHWNAPMDRFVGDPNNRTRNGTNEPEQEPFISVTLSISSSADSTLCWSTAQGTNRALIVPGQRPPGLSTPSCFRPDPRRLNLGTRTHR